jgi:catechol 2,3-dioxygenase-like lactoylglutathione lyase family enzyme
VLWSLTAHGADFSRADLLRNLIDLTPNEAGVSMGQWCTIVRDVDATKQFWSFFGATVVKVDGTDAMKMHGVLVVLRKGEPSGGSTGSTVDHVGVRLPNGAAFVAKLKAAGVKTDPDAGVQREGYQGLGWGNVYSPDGLKVEILGDDNLSLPITGDHIHFSFLTSVVPDVQEWYAKTFSAQAFMDTATNPSNPAVTVDIPGVQLKFGKASKTTLPTKGRALDHIGFEVRNLEAFCKKLQTAGIKFDLPYSKTRHSSYASAELTDPWGTSIELTEGLNR